MSSKRLLVPVSDTETIRQTVEYAVSRALEAEYGTVRFVVVHPADIVDKALSGGERDRDLADAEELLNRVSVWAEEDAGDRVDTLRVETDHIGLDRYIFSPEDVAEEIATEVGDADIDLVVLDPEYNPGIGSPFVRPLEYELSAFDVAYEEAPITRQTRRAPLLLRTTLVQTGALFLVSFFFYMLLAAKLFSSFEWVTGIISATVVAVSLSQVTLTEDPTTESVGWLLRHIIYVPYLLWEIVKSNIMVAAVILNPRLPIEPRMTRIRPAVWGGLPITSLANSITLTPGTLTVRVDEDSLIVHTLVVPAREGLFDGGLERAVRFVFYGRKAMNIPSPLERGDTEILQPPDEDSEQSERATSKSDNPGGGDGQSRESESNHERSDHADSEERP